jgi:hypothetical protein
MANDGIVGIIMPIVITIIITINIVGVNIVKDGN